MDIASPCSESFAHFSHFRTEAMVVYNYSGKEINAKIVYYGPALSGKTTNLEWIYSKIPVEYSGKMVSLRTQADRTIFFDFLPLDLGMIDGFRTRFMLYTVPGQVHYNATRKMVLKGVDGLVFVADSEPGRMADNIESLQNLRDNLTELGLDPDSLPLVLQWNKRDLPHCMSTAELESQLNPRGLPSFEACALTGEGVYETLHKVCRLIYTKLTGLQMGGGADGEDVSLFGDPIAQCLQDVDVPEPEPERVALDAVAMEASSSGPRSAADVLGAILGSRSVPPVTGEVPSVSEEVPVAVGAEPDSPPSGSTQRISPVGGAQSGQTPSMASRGPSPDNPGSQSVRLVSESAKSQGPKSSSVEPIPTEEDSAVDDLVDEVLFRLDETDENEAQTPPPPPTPDTTPTTPTAPAPPVGEIEHPEIEHEPNIFDQLQPVREEPVAAPSGSIPVGGISLDDVLGEGMAHVGPEPGSPEDVEFITDPLKLPSQRAASGPQSDDSVSPGLGSGAFGAPPSNAKIIEVPVTLDADLLEEGRAIRVVLNLTVKR